MDKEYYLLSAENNWFPSGCIFEMCEKQKLLCLDNSKICTNLNKVFHDCIKIDRKSANLLLATPLKSRSLLWNDSNWSKIVQLDVGDECFHVMTGHEMPCKIVSKQITDKGIAFTITMENGKRCNVSIDRLRIKKMIQTITSPKSQNATWSGRSLNAYDQPFNKDSISKCRCLSNILQKAHNLDLSLKDKEVLFRNLFYILPKLPDDDEGKGSLHWACYYLLIDSVTILINSDHDVNKQDKQGNSPLYHAVNSPLANTKEIQTTNALEKILITLILQGANIKIRNNQNETPLIKLFKNGYFSVLETMFEYIHEEFYLSDHLLSDQDSILELLIKLKMFPLASLCCQKSKSDPDQNVIFLKSAATALSNGARDLCIEILEKASDVDETLPGGELFVTQLLSDLTVNAETVSVILNLITFKFNKCNHKGEHPLSLTCRRLMVDVVKLIFNKGFVEVTKINDALGETIKAYSEIYINFTYKSIKPAAFQSITQVKQTAIEILNLLLKNGANIETAKPSVINSIGNCVDIEFAKVIKHLCRMLPTSAKDDTDNIFSFSAPVQGTNQCSICMDKMINCAFGCGHTCCFECGEKIQECHACRSTITERRKIFIS